MKFSEKDSLFKDTCANIRLEKYMSFEKVEIKVNPKKWNSYQCVPQKVELLPMCNRKKVKPPIILSSNHISFVPTKPDFSGFPMVNLFPVFHWPFDQKWIDH
jgi:hypothetical protein